MNVDALWDTCVSEMKPCYWRIWNWVCRHQVHIAGVEDVGQGHLTAVSTWTFSIGMQREGWSQKGRLRFIGLNQWPDDTVFNKYLDLTQTLNNTESWMFVPIISCLLQNNILNLKFKSLRVWEHKSVGKMLACKHKDLSLMPRTHLRGGLESQGGGDRNR